RGIAAAMLFTALGAAVVVLVHRPSTGSQALVSGFTTPRSAVDVSAPRSVEQIAAKVLPSMVTLLASGGGDADVGSGIALSPDGLIMTNNNVDAASDAGRKEPARTVVKFHDGRR